MFLRDWFFSLLTLVAFGVTLVVYDIKGRVAIRRGLRPFEETMAALQSALLKVFGISGVSVTTEGRDLFEPTGGYIFVSNHQSMFDVPIFGGILTENYPKYVAKAELAKGIPSISLNLRVGGNALIDRKDRSQATAAIAQMGADCEQRGVSAVIFPEGTRSRDGSLGGYKLLGLTTLLESAPNLRVVPTVIDGSWRVFANNMLPVPYGSPVRIRFGEPIARRAGESAQDIADRCREWTQSVLDEWGPGSPHTA